LTFDINADGSQPCSTSTSTLVPEKGKNKRSRQISRKKKYCPKVVCEGKPKRTPVPKTPKPALERASASTKKKKKKNNFVTRTLIFETQNDMEKPQNCSATLDLENHSSIITTLDLVNTELEKQAQVDQCCTSRRLGPNFPQLWKKRRAERRRRKNMATIICLEILTSPEKYCYSASMVSLQHTTIMKDKRFKCEETLCQPEAKRTRKRPNMYTRRHNMHTRRLNTADLTIARWPIQNLCKTLVETKKKKRSKGCTRRRSNLTALPVCNQLQSERQEQKLEISHGPEIWKDAFVNSEFYAGKSEASLAKDSKAQLRGTFHSSETTYWIVSIDP
jgi:hypothetical protein